MTGELAPIPRIFSALLWYAIKEGAEQFRVMPQDRGSLVQKLKGETWGEMLRVPAYIHMPLLTHAKSLAGLEGVETLPASGIVPVDLRDAAHLLALIFELRITVTGSEWGECLYVAIQPDIPEEMTEGIPNWDDLPPPN